MIPLVKRKEEQLTETNNNKYNSSYLLKHPIELGHRKITKGNFSEI